MNSEIQDYCRSVNDKCGESCKIRDVCGTCKGDFINNPDTCEKAYGMLKPREWMVNHPYHYNFGSIEVIDVIEDWKLGFHLGNAVKYIARAGHKENAEEDIRKAIWYLNRYIGKDADNNG